MIPPPHVATAETALLESIPETVVVDELQIRINGWWRILNNKWRQSTLGPSPLKPREAISTTISVGEEEMERISEQQNRLTLKWGTR
jgi:hypothetical protein